ncbi:MAG TPA: NTF2 fold immunity protein [Duganella sp.]|uniref:NTF2 fold immunity protein n=1 Tax=Duganella sp. TaxID=1904440 RepID=UPI002ED4B28F
MPRKIVFQFLILAIIGILPTLRITNSYANNSLKQQMVKENGKVPKDGYVPQRGFVPDGGTAIAIAIAVLIPIYGQSVVDDEMPFTATLVQDTWVVVGNIKGMVGGVAEVDISKKMVLSCV